MRFLCVFAAMLLSLLSSTISRAAEGMWTLDNLPVAQLQSQYKFKPTQAWIDKVMHASVRLAQGCSGSFVSPSGLVLTNHHCASRCIEQLSNSESNYVRTGFVARARNAEMKCPELEVNQLQQITDITDKIKAATKDKEGTAYKAALNAASARESSACLGKNRTNTRCDVIELYHGGRYHLYRYRRYQDVRLVWAPEMAAAFFGGDPDNFNFPRYDIDASLLRVYDNGKPVSSSDYFRIKAAGAEPKELTFVSGHPGSTQRELTVAQLETLRDMRIPRILMLYSELRGVLEQYQKSGAEAGRIAESDLFSTENSIKAFRGQQIALQSPELMDQKRDAEHKLQQFVAEQEEFSTTAAAWQDIAKAEKIYREIGDRHFFIETSRGFMSKYYGFARTLVRGAAERAKPNNERLPEYTDASLPQLEQSLFSAAPVYPEYEKLKLAWSLTKLREWLGADDPLVRKVLGKETPEQLAERLVEGTTLKDPAARRALWENPNAIAESDDPFIQLARVVDEDSRVVRRRYDTEIDGVEQRAGQAIAEARFAMSGTKAYPDATFTLRLSFGEVKGWQEGEKQIAPFTTFGGAFQRHTGAEPFALPTSWLLAKSSLKQDTKLNFVTTNDIIGGNSGSPVINRNAELVGLVFDGNIHSLGGAFGYEAETNRTVAVHAAALLEALRKIYSAPELLKELNAK